MTSEFAAAHKSGLSQTLRFTYHIYKPEGFSGWRVVGFRMDLGELGESG
jgi:hypothetical protein